MTHYYDICWTLYRSNTTFDFIDYVLLGDGDKPTIVRERGAKYSKIRKLRQIRLFRLANLCIFKLTRRDLWREYAIKQLAGLTQKQVEQLAGDFADNHLSKLKISKIWEKIQTDGDNYLLSSTIEPIAKAVSQQIGNCPYKATTLEYEDDTLTGKICNDLLSCKISDDGMPSGDYSICTDNLTDINLIVKAKEATIVTYDNKQRWLRLLKQYFPQSQSDRNIKIEFIECKEKRY